MDVESSTEFEVLEGQTDIYGNVAEIAPSSQDADEWGDGRLFDGDTGTLPVEARLALTALVKRCYITQDDRKLWKALEIHQEAIASRLADMFLILDVRPAAGVAAALQADAGEIAVECKLKAARPLKNIDAVLLGSIAEAYFIKKASGGDSAYTDLDTLREAAEVVYGDSPDKVLLSKRVDASVKRLIDRGYLRFLPEIDRYQIMPALEFFDFEEVTAALETYKNASAVAADESEAIDEDAGVGGNGETCC